MQRSPVENQAVFFPINAASFSNYIKEVEEFLESSKIYVRYVNDISFLSIKEKPSLFISLMLEELYIEGTGIAVNFIDVEEAFNAQATTNIINSIISDDLVKRKFPGKCLFVLFNTSKMKGSKLKGNYINGDTTSAEKVSIILRNKIIRNKIYPELKADTSTSKNKYAGNYKEPFYETPDEQNTVKNTLKKNADIPNEWNQENEQYFPITTRLHSDSWTINDKLNYSLYAKSIAEFICHKETNAPLTIGILAPWGHGKTTLMRLIEAELKLKKKKESLSELDLSSGEQTNSIGSPEKINQKTISLRTEKKAKNAHTTFEILKNWLNNNSTFSIKKLTYPCVWFNAWKYQNCEQVWSGLAEEIVTQLVGQIPDPLDREKFWLKLNATRMDFNEIRRDIYKTVLGKVLPWLVGFFLSGIIGVVAFLVLYSRQPSNLFNTGFITFSLSVVGALLSWLFKWFGTMKNPLEGKYSKYVLEPSYKGKSGILNEIEKDLCKVFKLLINEEKPAVIFIDDLDRCWPNKIAEVMEAINTFISSEDFKSYFIIGMDVEVVSSSLEIAHKELNEKLVGNAKSIGSMGWYYMEKFIQLPFIIPNLSVDTRTAFFTSLINSKEDSIIFENKVQSDADSKVRQIISEGIRGKKDIMTLMNEVEVIQKDNPALFAEYMKDFIEIGAAQFLDKDSEVEKQFCGYASFLGTTPRIIKRFVNLYRFHRLIQWSRRMQKLDYGSSDDLGFWLVIMIRWPLLVRWIQWSNEPVRQGFDMPIEKARLLDSLISNSKTYDEWINGFKEINLDKNSWVLDKDLFRFMLNYSKKERLEMAVKCSIW